MDRQVAHIVESLWHKLQGGLQAIHVPDTMLGKLFAWHCETHLLFYKNINAVVLQVRQVVVVF